MNIIFLPFLRIFDVLDHKIKRGLSSSCQSARLKMLPRFFAQLKEGIDETVRALGEALSESDDSNPSAAPVVDYSQYLECDESSLRAIAECYNQDADDEQRENEFDNAIELYTKGIELRCQDEELNATMYTKRAKVHFSVENYRAALSDARCAREFEANRLEAIEIGASACIELGSYKEAVTWCDEGLAIDDRNRTLRKLKTGALTLHANQPGIDDDTLRGIADGYNKDGDAELRKDEFNSAIDLYTKGINVTCKDDQLSALLYANRASVYLLVGDFDAALRDAKCAWKCQPTLLKAIEKGASACFELARYEEAIAWCEDGLAVSFHVKTNT